MLTFLRKIRRSLAGNGSTRKYLFYAIGEILLVVIGILIALQVNNWNQNRKDNIESRIMMINLKNALTSDLNTQFATHIDRINSDMLKLDYLFNHINKKLPYHDSLNRHFGIISKGGNRNWTPNTSAYKILESQNMDLIQDDSLKTAILDIYNFHYAAIDYHFENYRRNIFDYGRPLARTLLKSGVDMFDNSLANTMDPRDLTSYVPLDYTSLIENPEFINILAVLKHNCLTDISVLLEKKKRVEDIIALIEEELQK